MGSTIQSTSEKQAVAKVQVFPGADGDFTLFADDGTTYNYERTGGSVTKLHWDDRAQQLTHTGAAAWTGADSSVVEVVSGK